MKKGLFIALIITAFFSGCKKSKCWKGFGEDVKEERVLTDFHTIEIYDNLNLIFTPGPHRKATIECPENLVDFIYTDIEDGVLTITDENKCDFVRGYDRDRNIYITGPSLEHVLCYNSGNVSITDTVYADYFTFEHWSASGINDLIVKADTVDIKLHTGTGDITAAGKTKQLFLYASSYGYADCYDLETVGALVTLRSTNNAYVNTTRRLNASIHSNADIYVLGDPEKVNFEQIGRGELIFE
ncbi:MAG: hypothetical protein GWP27_04880 [Bacteroidetes bacterium]|nr:hypothetical protein [Bacteroidota bacterium]